jgi:hypothetical protein
MQSALVRIRKQYPSYLGTRKGFESAVMRFAGLRNRCKYRFSVYHKPLLSASTVDLNNRTEPDPNLQAKTAMLSVKIALCFSHKIIYKTILLFCSLEVKRKSNE